MTLTTIGTSLVGLVAAVCTVVAGATIWLLLSDPITVAGALHEGTVTPLVGVLAQTIIGALRGLLSFL
jgi:hypothetical protein